MASRALVLCVAVVWGITPLLARGVPGATTPPTGGQPWPMPQVYQPTAVNQFLNQESFEFRVLGQTCDILEAAVDRYFELIFYPDSHRAVQLKARRDEVLRFSPYNPEQPEVNDISVLHSLTVDLMKECEHIPYLGMDESCRYTQWVTAFKSAFKK